MKCCALLVVAFGLLAAVSAAPEGDMIKSLPGANFTMNFKQYSGYININPEVGQFMHYWFVESQNDPGHDPVILWLNGGPGASSLMGLFEEHGPFRPNPDGTTLSSYPYAWNRIANVIYLESPLGVGFSYSNNPQDYITNDTATAQYNIKFLNMWFEAFPEFLQNDFYLTGESYAGHYIPQLANLLLEEIQNGTSSINMKGILMGNPVTDQDWYYRQCQWSYLTTLYSHGVIPQDAYYDSFTTCGWQDFLNPAYCDDQFNTPSLECRESVMNTLNYFPYSQVDPYDLYAPLCMNDTADSFDMTRYSESFHPLQRIMREYYPSPPPVNFYPCIDNYMTAYLNQPEVQDAINVNRMTWNEFGRILYINESALIMPLYQKFQEETDWRILIVSGDVDTAVPFLGTQRWVNCLGFPLVQDWTPWFYEEQMAGAYIEYEGLTQMTIKGCGHMIPWYCPEKGYVYFERWLLNKSP